MGYRTKEQNLMWDQNLLYEISLKTLFVTNLRLEGKHRPGEATANRNVREAIATEDNDKEGPLPLSPKIGPPKMAT